MADFLEGGDHWLYESYEESRSLHGSINLDNADSYDRFNIRSQTFDVDSTVTASYDIVSSDVGTSSEDLASSDVMTSSNDEVPQEPHIFEYCIMTRLTKAEETGNYQISITYSYPKQDDETLDVVSRFCFPDVEIWRPLPPFVSENYCFVLTKETGIHHYGYCRRYMPTNPAGATSPRLPEVVCIVSRLQATLFYEQLLEDIEALRVESVGKAEGLVRDAYDNNTTQTLNFSMCLRRDDTEAIQNVNTSRIMMNLSTDNLLYIFSKILQERRLIFTSRCLNTLSSCMSILVSFLYPFTWPHSYIPIMPVEMLGLCYAPTPYIVGILTTYRPTLRQPFMDKVTIVDLDTNHLEMEDDNREDVLPWKCKEYIIAALMDNGGVDGGPRDFIIRHAFVRMFMDTVGHYRQCITQEDSRLMFQKELFLRQAPSSSVRDFLCWFTETQIFECFITDKLENGIPTTGMFHAYLPQNTDRKSQCQIL